MEKKPSQKKYSKTAISHKNLSELDINNPESDELKRVLYELQVHKVELQMQNEELKKTEFKLNESHRFLKELFDFAPVGYLILNSNKIIENANLSFIEMAGHYKEDITGKEIASFIHKEDQNALYFFFNDLENNLSKSEFDARVIKSTGESVITNIAGKKIKFHDRSEMSYILTVKDITERIENQDEIKQINHELESRINDRTSNLQTALEKLVDEIASRQKVEEELRVVKENISKAFDKEKKLNRMKSALIAMISHEYRTPLTIIQGAADMISRSLKNKDERTRDYFTTITNTISDMTRLLEDTIAISEKGSDDNLIKSGVFDLTKLCKEVVAELEMVHSQKDLNFEFINKIQSYSINTDKNLLRRSLINILSNAVKFSGDGKKIEITLSKQSNNIEISIKDQGIGIAEEDKPYIFDSFFRGSNIGNLPGTGVGLTISKKFLDALGFSIEFESILNRGTTFTVFIPVSK